MARTVRREVLAGCVDEILGSLPAVADGVARFVADGDAEALTESQRLLHSAKGAAAMVGLPALSQIAAWQEELIEANSGPERIDELCDALSETLPATERYLTGLRNGLPDEQELFAEVFLQVRPLLFPDEGDERFAELWAEVGGAAAVTQFVDAADVGEVSDAPEPEAERGEEASDNTSAVDCDEIHAIDPELRDVFLEEAADHLQNLYAALEPLGQDHGNCDAVQQLRRAAHTLKGAAGAVGLRTVTRLAHRMEDLLDVLHDEPGHVTGDIVTLLYTTTDALHGLVTGEGDRAALAETVTAALAAYDLQCGMLAPQAEEPCGLLAPRAETSARSASSPQSNSRTSGPLLRVPSERIDDVVRLVGELMINRTAFEQRMSHFGRFVEELQLTLARLRRISTELETRYGVDALKARGPDKACRSHPAGSARGALPAGFDGAALFPPLRTSSSRLDEFDVLEFDRYTDFHLLARSLAESTSDVGTVAGELRSLMSEFDVLLGRQTRLARETQDKLMRVRMVPVETISQQLHRTVRATAQQQGKAVRFVLEGQHVELEKNVLENLADPLAHLLRNAVDHGVETAEVRRSLGKPEVATVSVHAAHQGTQAVVEVRDDGAGIDPERLRETAVANGFLSATDAAQLSEDELLQCVFLAGLSTSREVNEISGRGVGLDVVCDTVGRLKGTVRVESTLGQGTTFVIRLPLSMAVTRALLVTVRGEPFAIPMPSVEQVLRVDAAAVDRVGGEPVVQAGNRTVPLKDLGEHLGLGTDPAGEAARKSPTVVVLNVDTRRGAMRVDGILGARDVVVKSLGNHLAKTRGLIGATLLGDGTVVPILDAAALVGDVVQAAPAVRRPMRNTPETTGLQVMIVDDSVSVRRVTKNLARSTGWQPLVAQDGLHAIELLQSASRPPDVFLLDVEMPRMDGYELLGWLRGQAAYRHVPVVMVTSRAGQKHRDKAAELGANAYLVKPYQDDALVRLVEELASISAQTTQSAT